jgi:S-adenosylmethionine:tRNA ribosyltransferase-isomerase
VGPDGAAPAGGGETGLVVVPGFRFRAVDALVTNFHLPRSSLLLLVSASRARPRPRRLRRGRPRERYRFYSYGDAMLVT